MPLNPHIKACMNARKYAAAVLALLPGLLVACHAADSPAGYGTKVRYSKGAVVRFADFTMTYTGTRTQPVPATGKSMTFHEFEITSGGDKQKVSWSSGTGDIGPARFTAAGKMWQIELRFSDRLGRLKDSEMVVSALK